MENPVETQNLRILDVHQDPEIYSAIEDQIKDRNPRSALSGNAFQGANKTLLAIHSVANGFESDLYFTRTQIRACQAKVRKGERAARVVTYNLITLPNGQQVRTPTTYSVWAAEQLEELPEQFAQ